MSGSGGAASRDLGPGGGDQRIDVDDERNPAIAHDGRSRDAVDRAVIGFEALDDDLPLALQFIDLENDAIAVFSLDEERHDLLGGLVLTAKPEQHTGSDDRDIAAAQRHDAALRAEPVRLPGRGAEGLDDRAEGNHQHMPRDADHHSVEHGQRQRQAQGEGGAATGL